jgi:hypothetical protein
MEPDMIIGSSNYAMSSTSLRRVEQTQSEQVRMWQDQGRPNGRANSGAATRAAGAGGALNQPVAIPKPKVAVQVPAQQQPAAISGGKTPESDQSNQLAARGRFEILIAIVEQLTGRKVQVVDPSAVGAQGSGNDAAAQAASATPSQAGASGQTRQGWGIDYQYSQTRVEQQSTQFAASGQVTTTDGRKISFDIGMAMSRESVSVTNLRFQAGDPQMADPLVLNFGGGPVSLSPSKINFDLNSDGKAEQISFVAKGNGFLALDRNGNGAVDDGSELFGPGTGNGFAELAKYDQDGNGWIDEADPVYSQLRVWDDAQGGLSTLKEKGVGAIALGNVGTAFDLTSGDQTDGALRSTGIWLGENGGGGTIHHVDLAM